MGVVEDVRQEGLLEELVPVAYAPLLTALAACVVPAVRAARVDPVIALKAE